MTAAPGFGPAAAPARAGSALLLRRQPTSEWARLDGATTLGGLHYGASAESTPKALAHAGARLLRCAVTGDTVVDGWFGEGAAVAGQLGAVRWRHNGHWLFGAIDVQEGPDDGIEAVSRHAYSQVFRALRSTGLMHLQRVWNYVPGINVESDGTERYRLFNAGRQRAFLDDGRDVTAGSPAACALGTHDGWLRIRFLAGRSPAQPIENPRQVPAYRYPPDYGERPPSFSRAALVDAGADRVGLLISGTASIVEHRSVHPADLRAQVRETLANLQAVIDAANARSTARFGLRDLDCTVYLRRADDVDVVHGQLADALGAAGVERAVFLHADICRSELLVEIEGQCFAPGSRTA